MKLVEIVAIPPSALTLTEGERETLTATVYPEDATYTHVTWSSDNPTVASVDDYGIVYANSAGTAQIYAHAADSSGVYDVCTVTVEAAYVPVTGLTLDKSSMTLKRGEQGTLTATVLPENATRNTVSWSSSNSYIASVADGVVTANKRGEAVITAMCSEGNIYGDTCNVTVESNGMVESITLNCSSAMPNVNTQLQLTATVLPSDATNKTLQWTSSNTKVASVDPSTGLVTARSKGTAVITAQATDGSGIIASCTVTVYVPVKSITLDKSELKIIAGSQGTLTASVLPANANNKSYRWVSDNETVATVVGGVVTGRSIGNTTVSAISDEPTGVRGICTVYVAPRSAAVQSITISPSEQVMVVGDTAILQASVLPASAYNKDVTWSSSNTSVVTVQPSGLIRAVGEGEVTITATAQDGSGVTGSCVVKVKRDLVVISRDSDYVVEGFSGEWNFNKVEFTRSGKVWHCIDADRIYDEANLADSILSDRSNYNFYSNYHVDKDDNTVISTYGNEELRLLYAIDPYGVADYVKRYAAELSGGLEATIGYKDDIFEALFGRRPKHYIRTLDGENWVEITDYNSLSAVLSESELIFGGHPIYDAYTASQVVELIIQVLGDLIGCIPGVSTISSFISSAVIALLNAGLPSAGDAIYSYITYESEDSNADVVVKDVIELSWANKIVTFYSYAGSILDIVESTVADTTYFKRTLEYCYKDTVYDVVCANQNGERCYFKDIYNLLD